MRAQPELVVVANLDLPRVYDADAIPIPGNMDPPIQVVARMPGPALRIRIRDGIQVAFVEVYLGPVGQEQYAGTFGAVVDSILEVFVPAGERVSLRAEGAAPITTGSLMIEFLGVKQGK